MKYFLISFSLLFTNSIVSGQDWITQVSNTNNGLSDIYFLDSEYGFAVGEAGIILKTTNGGSLWVEKSSGTNHDLRSIHFIDSLTGFAISNTELIKTTNGGENWVLQDTMNYMGELFFTDADTGFVIGKSGLMKTTDGGVSWMKKSSLNMNVFSFWATDSKNMNVGSDDYLIVNSVDGGDNWDLTNNFGTFGAYEDMFFSSKDTGFAVSQGFAQGIYYGGVLKTTNGGLSWQNSMNQGSMANAGFYSVFFTDENTGYIAGFSDNGNLLKTSNAGQSWTFLTTNSSSGLASVFFPEFNIGYAVGPNGTIIKTVNGGLGVDDLVKKNELTIFPNPASHSISFQWSGSGDLKVEIIDITGKTIKLFHDNLQFINIADFPAGVYFLRLTSQNEIVTQKFVKQ